jgi:malonyl-CoA O-methyltransferase
MIDRLDYIKIKPQNILDIGSGLNIDSSMLIKKYPQANLVQIDSAINILNHYCHNLQPPPNYSGKVLPICADALALPIANNSINMVWSSMCLPYINDSNQYFNEIMRILNVEGVFLVCGFAVDSLYELRNLGLRTYNFPDMHIIGDILLKIGFSDVVTDVEYITIEYDSIIDMLNDIRIVGCGSIIDHKSMFNRQELTKILAPTGSDLPNKLTLEIFYAHGWKDKPISADVDNVQEVNFYPRQNFTQ